MNDDKHLLDSTESEVPFQTVSEVVQKLEQTADIELFHKIFVPFLKSIGMTDADVINTMRSVNSDKHLSVSRFTLRKAFIDTKNLIGKEYDEIHVHLIFEFCRSLGFSTLDTIKIFCNDRIA